MLTKSLIGGGRKTPIFSGFFLYKKWLPMLGEPYRLSKPIAGILRSKSWEEHKCSLTYTVNYSDCVNLIIDLYHEITQNNYF